MAHSSSPSDSTATCSYNSAVRVFSASNPSRSSPTVEKARHHRPSSYQHPSRYTGRSDKFYHLHDPPPLEAISKCVSGFIRGTGTFLFVLPEYEMMELINAIYHPGAGQSKATNSKLCELLAIGAVGSQYEDIGQETQMMLFKSAKWYLDCGFGRDDDLLRKMRTSMLVGLFLIFEKSFWAREYIDQAIEFARNKGLNTMQRHSDYSEREWACWKRMWGSLVFLDGWLSGSLGSLPTIFESGDPIYTEGYRTCTNDLDACLHVELIKLAIIMGHVTKYVYAPATLDFKKVALYTAKLKSWHSSLPEPLRLHRDVSGNDSRQRSTILLAHCSYLNSIILLTRRIYIERLEGSFEGLDGLARIAIADEYTGACVAAGRQLATVVGLLHEEGRIVRRCWILILAAYNAGLVVLLCMSARGSNGSSTDSVDVHDQDLICKCLKALEVPAAYDPVAQRFFNILSSVRRSLALSPNQNRQRVGTKRTLDHVSAGGEKYYPARPSQLTEQILDIFRQPFGGESNVIGQDDYTLSRFFPENWRFLAPEPSTSLGSGHLSHYGSSSLSCGSSSEEGDNGNSRKKSLPPFRTREEYEAFFRRIS